MNDERYGINIWINDERYEKLKAAGMSGMAKEVLAGLKVIQVTATAAERDAILARYPKAKCDTATTKTIELLPRDVKDRLLDLALQKGRVSVVADFLASHG